jgi:glycosyltransferase involved in cell wall biosynthesis
MPNLNPAPFVAAPGRLRKARAMRIAIDVSAADKAERTGIGKYVRSLVECLAAIDGENTYFLCHRLSRLRRWKHFLRTPKPNFRGKLLQEPFHPFFLRRLDVFHGPDARLPRFTTAKTVVTIHDVASLVSDEYADAKFRRMKIDRYRDLLDRASCIITNSESTRRDMVRLLDAPPEKVRTVPMGVPEEFRPCGPQEQAAVRSRYGLDKDFLLFVGAITRRKNIRRLLAAFREVSKARDVVLILAGRPGYGAAEELAPIGELGLKDRVRLLGYVAEADLPALYSSAKLFLFPSLYEGFGIPVLEAMACGTPVVTSDCSSLPEVAGGAALLVDPSDIHAIAEAALRLLDDEPLRQDLAARGIERAKQFSWMRTARETLEIYKSLCGT